MRGSLAPGFLVAAPPLSDPNFVRSLVLLVAHGEEGALGIVINGSEAVATLGELLEQLGLVEDPARFEEPVRAGGPVQPEIGWIVYAPDAEPREGEIKLSDEVAVTQSRKVLASIGTPGAPTKHATFLGYAGWGPGQLEAEIGVGAWLPVEIDASIVFEVPVEERWSKAFASAGVAPAAFMGGTRGSA